MSRLNQRLFHQYLPFYALLSCKRGKCNLDIGSAVDSIKSSAVVSIAGLAEDEIGAEIGGESVISVAAAHGVGADAAKELIVTQVAIEIVVAVVSVEEIVAVFTVEFVV